MKTFFSIKLIINPINSNYFINDDINSVSVDINSINADAFCINADTISVNADAFCINAGINSVKGVTFNEVFSTLVSCTSIVSAA
jgi:hypothetical protein